ncbi:hypothetical protein [Sphingomonas yabuuchiae]|uniref:Transmembrane protein n=1 Tax=Sphingomonas yabuuchiae TaxID=172044 RepID=A0AA41A1K4_9SPHN|nr:hypothetical protein [Sphingomonas yabuuchiae]MBB4610334.1 hypothetical protein [Sphingomonas yabuuchiae]MBN3560373.1 hypothetical protein [Sphingomonas yabuuchiae]
MTDLSQRDSRGPSERANHRLLALSGGIGGLAGLALATVSFVSTPQGRHLDHDAVWTSPLPLWFAILMALVWGVVIPVISWRWHRVVDEHERQAYRDGAVASFYTVALSVPVWWFLWRGGALPPVQFEWVYGAMLIVGSVVWLWRKYA